MRLRFAAGVALLVLPACRHGSAVEIRSAESVLDTVARAIDLRGSHAGGALEAMLPSSAVGTTRLGVAARDGVWVELQPIGLNPRPAEIVRGASVFREVEPDSDLVWVADGRTAEELRVLHSPAAPSTARYRIVLGPRVAEVRVNGDDVVEVVDAQGTTQLASTPLFAVDARGVHRSVHATVSRDDHGWWLQTSLETRDLAYPIVVDPAWTAVAPMGVARTEHTATTLTGDRVLVVGGKDASGAYLSTAEIFDPATKTWSAAASMAQRRGAHSATLLASGKVLVVGGTSDGANSLSTAQLFDPASGTWSAAASMSEVRAWHTATLLAGGKVLVAGGTDFSPGGESASAAMWDAATNTWSAAGTMPVGRQQHTATLLSTGQVLVVGGRRGGGIVHTNADLFDPAAKTWTAASAMSTPRAQHTATLLSGDRVLVTGGYGFDKYATLQHWSTAELYDPSPKTWKGTNAPMLAGRALHAAAALPGDRVLVFGGGSNLASESVSVELFTLSDARFAAFAPMTVARSSFAVAQLSNRNLLVTGGGGSTVLSGAEILGLGQPGDACKNGVTECASGLCVDGVCCNAACDGQCEACDVEGSKGTCTTVLGKPHGKRATCSDGAGDACQAKHCDGVDRTSCAAFADSNTACAPASCADGMAKPPARCDGKGLCSPVTSTACAPYACGVAGCKSNCAGDADCAGSNVCDKNIGRCVVADSTCSDDGLSSQPLDRTQPAKSCAPYRCDPQLGRCMNLCTSSDACAPGTICDATTQTCVGAAPPEDDGGCAFGVSTRAGRGLALAGLAFLLFVSRRRRHV